VNEEMEAAKLEVNSTREVVKEALRAANTAEDALTQARITHNAAQKRLQDAIDVWVDI